MNPPTRASASRSRAVAKTLAARPVEDSGLPPRLISALHAQGVTTWGQWAESVAAPAVLSDVAKGSPEWAQEDAEWLRRLAVYVRDDLRGEAAPLSFVQWLELFLPSRWLKAVQVRRALDREGDALPLHDRPLCQVGEELGVTRERARQLLESAQRILSAPLAQEAARPLYASARRTLLAAGGGMTPAEWTAAVAAAPLWSGASPSGALLWLSNLVPDGIGVYRKVFVALPDALIGDLDGFLHGMIHQMGTLVTLQMLAQRFPLLDRFPEIHDLEPFLALLARQSSECLLTRDGRVGLCSRDASSLLREILLAVAPTASASEGMPLTALTEAFHARVVPESQRGRGQIRTWALADPWIQRVAPDRFALLPGYQPTLFET